MDANEDAMVPPQRTLALLRCLCHFPHDLLAELEESVSAVSSKNLTVARHLVVADLVMALQVCSVTNRPAK